MKELFVIPPLENFFDEQFRIALSDGLFPWLVNIFRRLNIVCPLIFIIEV